MKKHTLLFLIIICAAIGCSGAALVSAQQFKEPGSVQLPAPVTSTDASQVIQSRLALGATLQDAANILNASIGDAALFVKGSMTSKDNPATTPVDGNAKVAIDGSANPTLAITNHSVLIGYADGATCNNKVCVKSNTGTSSVDIQNAAGTALFAETTVAGAAGVYGIGYYGVEANSTTSSATALQAISCKEVVGAPGVCETYGDAGYFEGNVQIETVGGNPSGVYSGNGQNLFKVKSLYNKNTTQNYGIAYKTFATIPNVGPTVPGTQSVALGVTNVISVIGVESSNGGTTWVPIGKNVNVVYDGTSTVTLTNKTLGTTSRVQLLVTFSE